MSKFIKNLEDPTFLRENNNILNSTHHDLETIFKQKKIDKDLLSLILICIYNGTESINNRSDFTGKLFKSESFTKFWQKENFNKNIFKDFYQNLNVLQHIYLIHDLQKNKINNILEDHYNNCKLIKDLIEILGNNSDVTDIKAYNNLKEEININELFINDHYEDYNVGALIKTLINVFDPNYLNIDQIYNDMKRDSTGVEFINVINKNVELLSKRVNKYKTQTLELLKKYYTDFSTNFKRYENLKNTELDWIYKLYINKIYITDYQKFLPLIFADYSNQDESLQIKSNPSKYTVIYNIDRYNSEAKVNSEYIKGSPLKLNDDEIDYIITGPADISQATNIFFVVYGGKKSSKREEMFKPEDLSELEQEMISKENSVIIKLNLPDLAELNTHQAMMSEQLHKKEQDCIHKSWETINFSPEDLHPSLSFFKDLPKGLMGGSFGGLMVANHSNFFPGTFNYYVSILGGLSSKDTIYSVRNAMTRRVDHLDPTKNIDKSSEKILLIQNFDDHNVSFKEFTNFCKAMYSKGKANLVDILINCRGIGEGVWSGHGLSLEKDIFDNIRATIYKFINNQKISSPVKNDLEIFIKNIYWNKYCPLISPKEKFISEMFRLYDAGKLKDNLIYNPKKLLAEYKHIFYAFVLPIKEDISDIFIKQESSFCSFFSEIIKDKLNDSTIADQIITKAIALDFNNFLKFKQIKDVSSFEDIEHNQQLVDLYKSWAIADLTYKGDKLTPSVKYKEWLSDDNIYKRTAQIKIWQNIFIANSELFDDPKFDQFKKDYQADLEKACDQLVWMFTEYQCKVENFLKEAAITGESLELDIDYRKDFPKNWRLLQEQKEYDIPQEYIEKEFDRNDNMCNFEQPKELNDDSELIGNM